MWPFKRNPKVEYVDPAELNPVLEMLVGYEVQSLTSTPPTLEELFLRHYGEDIAAPSRKADDEVVTAR